MKLISLPNKNEQGSLLKRPKLNHDDLENKVRKVLREVRDGGDSALLNSTRELDGVRLQSVRVPSTEIAAQADKLSPDIRNALAQAYENVKCFHSSQQESVKKIITQPGVECWRKSVPIESVGLYIPGGSAPLFSTLLMLGVPATLAGCKEIIVCTPPQKDGSLHPSIAATARILGLDTVFSVGGAQAIAGMHYATESIPKVHKIFGPGNQYVTMAKMLVSLEGTAIDLPAGPSEVLVFADQNATPAFVASDLIAQAEHGPDSQVIVTCDNPEFLKEVIAQVDLQLEDLPRREIALKALAQSYAIEFPDLTHAMRFSNRYAPEHLILHVDNPDDWAKEVVNAGSVFLGSLSPEAAGDYASGTNHTLPTNRHALAYSGVSLDSFVKKITFQKINHEGLKCLGPVVEALAHAEGLEGHKRSVSIRLKSLEEA